jgi:XTP/dITP diphosphohydrolase
MDLLVATRNAGKVREFRALLATLPVPLHFPAELGLEVSVVESGSTYAENACIKAHAYSRALKQSGVCLGPCAVLADDSGLEVDALGGAPGLRSARYTEGSDSDRLTALLTHLGRVPWEGRTARFRCVVAIATPAGAVHTAEGTCAGVIATAPAGEGGFGYDPVFYMPEFGCTMAELPAEIKNQVSHRARAVQAALPLLQRLVLAPDPGM